ncbi:pilin [Reinekea sp.]|jgi:hypothetical protein|uniref:pilin n=1 Tax=Reinekea sp. TaxID=1970455 RepID=UPI003989E501
MTRYWLIAVLTACFVISGCTTTTVKQTPIKSEISTLVSAPRLNKKLPASAYGYLRIPNTWSFFSAEDDSFNLAQGNEAHVAQLQQLQKGLVKVLGDEFQAEGKLVINLFAEKLKSPLEVVLYPADGTPLPYALASAQLTYESATQLNPLLDEIESLVAGLNIAQYFSDTGNAKLTMGPVSIILQYNSEHTLTVLAGMAATDKLLTAQLAALEPTIDVDFLNIEKTVDAAGNGTLVWVNTKTLMPMVYLFAPEQGKQLTKLGLADISSVGAGMGSANGKGRLRVQISTSAQSKLFQQAPSQNIQPEFKTVGEPSFVAQIRLPNQAQISEIIKQVSKGNEDIQVIYDALNKEISDAGFDALGYFDNFGHLTLFEDDIGFFAAQHIRDSESHTAYVKSFMNSLTELTTSDELIERANYKNELGAFIEMVNHTTLESRTYAGQEIFHLTVPSYINSMILQELDDAMPLALMKVLGGGNGHLYWMMEDDFIIYASLPQLLVERARNKKTVTIQQWLQNNGLDQQHSFITASGLFDGGKISLYHHYLNLLKVIADGLDTEFDIFSFPTASELALSDPGLTSVQLDWAPTGIALELTYEKTPVDLLLMADSSMTTVATIGVLAAIAIPQYQEYVVRSKIQDVYSRSQLLQDELVDYHLKTERFPDSDAFEALQFSYFYNDIVYYTEIDPETGVVAIYLDINEGLSDEVILLTPFENAYGGIEFMCESTLANKYLPPDCK